MPSRISDKRRDYLTRRIVALKGGVNAIANSFSLAAGYCRVRVRRNRRGDLLLAGLTDRWATWEDRTFVEEFYLERVGNVGDPPPYQTIYGTFDSPY